MTRSKERLNKALALIPELRAEFWQEREGAGERHEPEPGARKSGQVADFLDSAELMAKDALQRNESCGAHFRVEHQTPDGEAIRDDKNFSYVSAWEYKGGDKEPELHKEPLVFEHLKLATRSYK